MKKLLGLLLCLPLLINAQETPKVVGGEPVDIKDYPWQIEGDNILMLPHVLDVQVKFTPIHNFLPEKSVSSQFISTNTSISYPNTLPAEKVEKLDVGKVKFDVEGTAQERAGEKINVGGVEYDVLSPTADQYQTGEIMQTYTGNNN